MPDDRVPDVVGLGRVDERLPEHLAADLRRLVFEGVLERDVRAALGHDAPLVDEAEEARRVVRDGVEECPLALLLGLEPVAIGDVRAADQDEVVHPPRHVGDRDGRPHEDAGASVGRQERRLDVVRGVSTRRGRDRAGCTAVVVLDEDVEERSADELLVGPVDGLLERPVRPDARVVAVPVTNRPVGRQRDHDARHRVEHRRLDVALALQLELALAPHGDVGAARDDRDHVAVRIVDGCRPPEDHPAVAPGIHERVLVLACREVGRERCEALSNLVALPGVDEDVPVVAADDVPLVLVARYVDCGSVEVADHAVGIDGREQARNRVRHGVPERHLGSKLRLQPVVLQGEPGGRRHGVEELGLVVERSVVLDRGDVPAVVLDELHRPPVAGNRLVGGVTLRVDPAATCRSLTLLEPVENREVVVAQRARERIAKRRTVFQRDDELGDRDAAQARSAVMTSPERSPLGTKPHAHEDSTRSP